MRLGTSELVIILILVLLLFGAKRLPDTARGLGRSLRIFKAETKGLRDDEDGAAEREQDALPELPGQSSSSSPDASSVGRREGQRADDA